MNNAIDRIQRRGVLAARASTASLRSTILNAMVRRHYVPGVRKLVTGALLDLMTDALTTAHLRALASNPLKLSIYDETMEVLARRSRANLSELQVQYRTRALKVLNDVSDSMESRLAKSLNDIMRKGAHVSEALEVLNDDFDALGLAPENDYKLETIFRTQSQMAYGAGRWEADQDPDVQEILWGYTYSAVGDDRTRPTHDAMNGVTLPKEDEFWQRWWPPNGWNCRCQVIPLFEPEEIVEPDRSLQPDEGFGFNPGRVFAITASYNPDQPRDASGRWGSSGAGGAGAPGKKTLAGRNKEAIAERRLARMALRVAKAHGDRRKIAQAAENLQKKIVEAAAAKARWKGAVANKRPQQRPQRREPDRVITKDKALTTLSSGRIKSARDIDDHHGVSEGVKRITFDDGMVAIYKPAEGEPGGLRDYIKAGTYYRREAAAYAVAREVGMADLVPPTTTRVIGGKVGSVQQWVDGAQVAGDLGGARQRSIARSLDGEKAAAFDYVLGNTDRHDGNWLVKNNKPVLIDNGLCLGKGSDLFEEDRCMRLGFIGRREKGRMDSRVIDAWRDKWPKVERALRDNEIEPKAITLAKERYDRLMTTGKIERVFKRQRIPI